MTRFVAGLGIALLPLALFAQTTYKWKDKHGQVHFSEVPPKGVQSYETIVAAPPPAAAPTPDALSPAPDAAQQEQAAQLAAQQQALREQYCKEGIERVAWLDARPPVRLMTKDAEGKATRMTVEEHAKQRAEAQARVDKYCD